MDYKIKEGYLIIKPITGKSIRVYSMLSKGDGSLKSLLKNYGYSKEHVKKDNLTELEKLKIICLIKLPDSRLIQLIYKNSKVPTNKKWLGRILVNILKGDI